MKKIVYLLLLSVITCLVSCNKNDQDENPLANQYGSYEEPYFVFEYATDTIQMQDKKIAVEDFKKLFTAMAAEKMSAYFKGIHFGENQEMQIDIMKSDGTNSTVSAFYNLSDSYMQVTLSSDFIGSLSSKADMTIPSISFHYRLDGKRLSMYFDKSYVTVIYAIMKDKLCRAIAGMMGMDLDLLPDSAQSAILKGIEQQIDAILNQVQKLEIGFVLTRSNSNGQ